MAAVGSVGLVDAAALFGGCVARAWRFGCARSLADFRGACTLISGKVAGSDVLPTTTGAVRAGSGEEMAWAKDRCANVVVNAAIKASSRNRFGRDV